MNSIPRTALAGRSQSMSDKIAKGLGYFSIALGLAELVASRSICRAVGLDGHTGLVRAYGVREIGTGWAILISHDATPWVWGLVVGNAADVATVAAAAENFASRKTLLSVVALVGATALDLLSASRLSAEKGGRSTARTDYRDRSGFPHGLAAARGAARNLRLPRDMRAADRVKPTGGVLLQPHAAAPISST